MYFVSSYNLKENKAAEYQNWLRSDEAKKLFADFEEETGWHYVETFWRIMGFGEYDVEDWWEVPDWSALDKMRGSKTWEKLIKHYNELDVNDPLQPSSTRMLRTNSDVRVWS